MSITLLSQKTHGNGPAKSTDDFSHTAVGDSPKSSAVNLNVEANKGLYMYIP